MQSMYVGILIIGEKQKCWR